MSSSPTDPTSTTGSSTSSPSRPDACHPRPSLVACGAIAQPAAADRRAARLAGRRAPAAAAAAQPAAPDRRRGRAAWRPRWPATYAGVAVGYADCGTYGALDEVCDELGLRRLPGLHCYDLFAGEEPAGGAARRPSRAPTCSPTSWSARSSAPWSASSGWTAGPSCATTTSGHYTRVVWLAQEPDAELPHARPAGRRPARAAADRRHDRHAATRDRARGPAALAFGQ